MFQIQLGQITVDFSISYYPSQPFYEVDLLNTEENYDWMESEKEDVNGLYHGNAILQ